VSVWWKLPGANWSRVNLKGSRRIPFFLFDRLQAKQSYRDHSNQVQTSSPIYAAGQDIQVINGK